jgi:hypothetical protein
MTGPNYEVSYRAGICCVTSSVMNVGCKTKPNMHPRIGVTERVNGIQFTLIKRGFIFVDNDALSKCTFDKLDTLGLNVDM